MVIIFGFVGKKKNAQKHLKPIGSLTEFTLGFKFVLNLLLYVFLNLNFSQTPTCGFLLLRA